MLKYTLDKYALQGVSVPATGMVAWYKADAIVGVAEGGTVASWPDSSGNNYHAVQATEAYKPLYKGRDANGRAAVLFDGSNDYMDAAGVPSTAQPTTVALVFKQTVSGGVRHIIDGITARQVVYTFANAVTAYAGSSRAITVPLTIPTGWMMMVGVFNGASSFFRVNGLQTTPATPGTGAMQGIRIGTYVLNNAHWAGYVAEIIFYSGQLSASEIARIERYLGKKYSI